MKKQRCSIFIVSCLLLYTFHVARAADTVGPVLICPADITVLCGDSDAPSTTGTPVVSDDSGKFCLNYVDSIVPGECPTVWIILREWLATDAAGNVSRCEQVITVTDATPPVLSGVPADVEVECGSVPPPALVSARDGCDACSRESLVLYYAFDHDNGAFVEDTSGYGNHGIATGGTFSPDGRLGGARYFNGSDDFIFVPASESLTIGGSITLAVWFKPVHYVFHGQLPIVEWNNGTRAGVHLWSNVHGYQWQGKGTGANLVDVTGNEINHVISTDNPPPQEWHHLVVTYDRESGLARLYLNGELTVEKNLGSMTLQTAYDLFIGTRPSQNDAWFFGWLDEVRVYNRALSPREIEALHASGDCRVHLRFEEFREGECPAAVIRVWSATDACGNTASATQVITVTASSRIALNGVPADMTVECGSEPAPARVTATSRCLPHGLALYYPFDEDSGDITVDFSGNNRTGTVNGATWIEDGARGGAYRFDAINQNITADDAGLPSGNSARTLAMWVKLDSLYSDDSTEYFSYGTRNYNQLTSLGIDWRNNRDRFNFSQYGGVFLSQQQIDRESEWYHVVYTYDGSHQFYINGNSSSGMNELWGPLNTTLSGVLMLGGHPQNGGSLGPDGGYLDEVMVFNRALTPAEVADLYTRDIPVAYSEIVDGDCPAIITRTWTATDACGNMASASQRIALIPANPLVLLNVPEDITVACGVIPPPADVRVEGPCITPVLDGLVVHYTFDSLDQDMVRDVSGNNRHSQVAGAQFDPNGILSGAIRFDGVDDYTLGSDEGFPSGSQPRSIAWWYKIDQIQNTGIVMMVQYGAELENRMSLLGVDVRNGRTQTYYSTRGPDFWSQTKIETGVWYHAAYVYDGGHEHTFYINGQPNSGLRAMAVPDTILGGIFRLGWRVDEIPMKGLMDDFRIYNREISAEEVVQLYQASIPVILDESIEGDCPAVVTRTWTATDACGNTVGATQVITVVDAGELDSDGDGVNDRDEGAAGTNPHDHDDFFSYTMASENNKIVVTYASKANRVYTLQYSEQLSGGAWSNVVGQIRVPGSGGTDSLSDTMNNPTRVYRVIVELP